LFTSGGISIIISVIARVAVPNANNKLQEKIVTDEEVKEDEVKLTRHYKREGEEGQSRISQLGSGCWVTQ
jgi:hypothetical protein